MSGTIYIVNDVLPETCEECLEEGHVFCLEGSEATVVSNQTTGACYDAIGVASLETGDEYSGYCYSNIAVRTQDIQGGCFAEEETWHSDLLTMTNIIAAAGGLLVICFLICCCCCCKKRNSKTGLEITNGVQEKSQVSADNLDVTYRPKDVSKSHLQEVSAISDPQDISRQVQEEEVNSDFEVAVYRPKLEEAPQSDSLNITLVKGNQT